MKLSEEESGYLLKHSKPFRQIVNERLHNGPPEGIEDGSEEYHSTKPMTELSDAMEIQNLRNRVDDLTKDLIKRDGDKMKDSKEIDYLNKCNEEWRKKFTLVESQRDEMAKSCDKMDAHIKELKDRLEKYERS